MKPKFDFKKTVVKFFCISQGFTLAEVLIALLILTTALFAIMSTTSMLVKEDALNKMRTTATTLAKDKMESLKTDGSIADGSDSVTMDSIVYTRAWDIIENSPTTGMKTITVTVTWSFMGKSKSVSLSTLVS